MFQQNYRVVAIKHPTETDSHGRPTKIFFAIGIGDNPPLDALSPKGAKDILVGEYRIKADKVDELFLSATSSDGQGYLSLAKVMVGGNPSSVLVRTTRKTTHGAWSMTKLARFYRRQYDDALLAWEAAGKQDEKPKTVIQQIAEQKFAVNKDGAGTPFLVNDPETFSAVWPGGPAGCAGSPTVDQQGSVDPWVLYSGAYKCKGITIWPLDVSCGFNPPDGHIANDNFDYLRKIVLHVLALKVCSQMRAFNYNRANAFKQSPGVSDLKVIELCDDLSWYYNFMVLSADPTSVNKTIATCIEQLERFLLSHVGKRYSGAEHSKDCDYITDNTARYMLSVISFIGTNWFWEFYENCQNPQAQWNQFFGRALDDGYDELYELFRPSEHELMYFNRGSGQKS